MGNIGVRIEATTALRLVLAAFLLAALSGTPLSALPLGPVCGSCFGGIYDLNGYKIASTATTETWRITYSLDLSGYNGPNTATYVGSIAAKVVSGPNLYSWSTYQAPTSGNWTMSQANVNSNGCDGSGGGWVCLLWASGNKLQVNSNSVYSWIFDVTIKPGTLIKDGASIQANFDPATGVLMSEKISMPEGTPGEIPIGLSACALFLWWRFRARRQSA